MCADECWWYKRGACFLGLMVQRDPPAPATEFCRANCLSGRLASVRSPDDFLKDFSSPGNSH